jgi:hypothetical protein
VVGRDDGLLWHMVRLGNLTQGLTGTNDDEPAIGCGCLGSRRPGRGHSRLPVQEDRRRFGRFVSAGCQSAASQNEGKCNPVLLPSPHVSAPVTAHWRWPDTVGRNNIAPQVTAQPKGSVRSGARNWTLQ